MSNKPNKQQSNKQQVEGWQSCYNRALDLLARREHSASELSTKLISKGFAEADVDKSLVLLQDNNLQSDQRFAESYVRSRVSRGFGVVKITSELYQRDVNDSLVAAALDPYQGKWIAIGMETYQKKYRNGAVNNYNEWSKRARFLQSRGFTSNQIRKIIDFDSDHLD